MFSMSSKCRYGINAVLALGENYGRGLMQIKDIAAQKQIPRQYLEQIFNRLVNAGLVTSVRGKKGGYQLAEPPNKVNLLEIIEILEGGISLAGTPGEGADAVFNLFQKAENQLKQELSITLAKLIDEQQSLQENMMFHI